MPRDVVAEGRYAQTLDALRVLAQRDLLSWWKNTLEMSFADQRKMLLDPFQAIVATYGEQAAFAAANYLFVQRSLDENLAGLEYPEVADPINFEQARNSFRYATWLREYSEDPTDRAAALVRLQAITNRLVAQPGRDTIYRATQWAKTLYARVPEPGACAFCLMLGSRGAVYTAGTVLSAGGEHSLHRYHDNCRCLGIEVTSPEDLPLINKQLEELWVSESKKTSKGTLTEDQWKKALEERKLVAQSSVGFPPVPGVRPVEYSAGGTRVINGVAERLPDLTQLAGHVLFGWATDGQPQVFVLDKTQGGHTSASLRPRTTRFPSSWTDQMIVDALVQTLETGTVTVDGEKRVFQSEIQGVKIKTVYEVHNGRAVRPYGYPLKTPGSGVSEVDKKGREKW